MSKPVLFVTRRLPQAVEARAARDYDARLNPDDTPRTGADIIRLAEGADAILCCPAEKLDAATIAALPASVKAVGTFSVGYDHIDVPALHARNIPLMQHARCAQRRHRRNRHDADPHRRPPRRRRRAPGPLRQMGRLGPHPAHRHANLRPPPRHFRHGPHRPRTRPHGARLRHGNPLSRHRPPAARTGTGRHLPRHATKPSCPSATCSPCKPPAAVPPITG